MSNHPQALWRALRECGLVGASVERVPLPGAGAHERPWYIALLLGASGWFAGLFLLGFVTLLFRPDDPAQAGLAGAVLLAAAWGLFKADREGVFVAQLALALSIAGQCLMLFAMIGNSAGLAAIASAALLLQCALALAMPNRLHRTLSALFATIALALTVRFALFGEPDFWRDVRVPASLAQALASWVFAWLPIGALSFVLVRSEAAWMARGWQAVLRPVGNGLIVGLAFATLASQPFESFRIWGGAPVRADWLALWPLLSAIGALAGAAAAFALRSRTLVGGCVLAALLHLSHFYYALGAGLLVKSVLMLAMGAALLLAARPLAREEAT